MLSLDFADIAIIEIIATARIMAAIVPNFEIIGTFVVPEFGTIAAMILAVAIISIVAISAKSRLSILSRY